MAARVAQCCPHDDTGRRLMEAVSHAIESADALIRLQAMLDELLSSEAGVLEAALAYRDAGGCGGDENALPLLHLAACTPLETAEWFAPVIGPCEQETRAFNAAAVITLLIKYGADPNVRAQPTAYGYGGEVSEASRGSRPLHAAITAPVVRALLLGGADLDAVDDDGVSAARRLLENSDAWRGGANSAVSALLAVGYPHGLQPAEHLRLACKYGESMEVPCWRWIERPFSCLICAPCLLLFLSPVWAPLMACSPPYAGRLHASGRVSAWG